MAATSRPVGNAGIHRRRATGRQGPARCRPSTSGRCYGFPCPSACPRHKSSGLRRAASRPGRSSCSARSSKACHTRNACHHRSPSCDRPSRDKHGFPANPSRIFRGGEDSGAIAGSRSCPCAGSGSSGTADPGSRASLQRGGCPPSWRGPACGCGSRTRLNRLHRGQACGPGRPWTCSS